MASSSGRCGTKARRIRANGPAGTGSQLLSSAPPGEVPIKYRGPDGTVAEIVPQGRYELMRAVGGK